MLNQKSDQFIAATIAIAVALVAWFIFGGTSSNQEKLERETSYQTAILVFQESTSNITHKYSKGQNISIIKPYGYCVTYTPYDALRITKHDEKNDLWDFRMRKDSVVSFQRIATHDCSNTFNSLNKNQGILIDGYHPIVPGFNSREKSYIQGPWDARFTIPTACKRFTLSDRSNGGNYQMKYQVVKPDGTYSPWLEYRDGQTIKTTRLWFRSAEPSPYSSRPENGSAKVGHGSGVIISLRAA
jgi:hypothetical protein